MNKPPKNPAPTGQPQTLAAGVHLATGAGSAESGFARRLKLHWVCPKCGKQDWGDLPADEPNPCLWFSNCPCVGKWIINYDMPDFQATPAELA